LTDASRIAAQIRQEAALERAETAGHLALMAEQLVRLKGALSELLAGAQSKCDAPLTLAVVGEYGRLISTELKLIKTKRHA
jgi:hypothetical protein